MATKSSCARDPRVEALAPAVGGQLPRIFRPALGRGFLLLLILWGDATVARAADADATLNIGVRSMVTGGTPAASRELPEHGRVYAILDVQNVNGEAQLVKPMDEDRLLRLLLTELDAHGFRPAQDRERPEILLTVIYGRGWLNNPYLPDGASAVFNVGSSPVPSLYGSNEVKSQNISGLADPKLNALSPGYEAKLQNASYEKLYIRVTAFANYSDPKARAHLLWQTTMIVDDPPHRDLNAIASQMLVAGAHYFDRAATEKEVTFTVAAPAVRVRVGTPEVVGETAAAPALAPAAPAVAPPPTTGLRKQFDLPAGEAAATLQAFSRQSGEEIIYPAEQVRAVRTQAVKGEFSARTALDRMLDQTGLVAEWNEKSGFFIIRRTSR